jgi:hypothetical protein
MKVLKLQLFEPISKPSRGPEGTRDGDPVYAVVAGKQPGGGDAKIYGLPGGQYLVDWGDSTIQSGAMTLVGPSDWKFAQVLLDDAEKAKLLK